MKLRIAAAIFAMIGIAAVAAGVHQAANSCDQPRYMLDSDWLGVQPAIDKWARSEFDSMNVAIPAAARLEAEFTGQTLRDYQAGDPLNPARLRLTVRLMDEAQETYFGVFPGDKGYKDYWLIVERDCADGDWKVTSAVLQHDRTLARAQEIRQEGAAGGKQVSENAP